MATINLTSDAFDSTVASAEVLFVDFWAAWCGPCQRFGPIFETASEKNPDITFAKVDTDAEQHLSAQLGIQSIPTLMAFKNGTLVFRQAGALNGPQFDQLITKVKEYQAAPKA